MTYFSSEWPKLYSQIVRLKKDWRTSKKNWNEIKFKKENKQSTIGTEEDIIYSVESNLIIVLIIIDPLLSVIRSRFGVAIFSSSIRSISTLISLKQLLLQILMLLLNIPLITRQWRVTHTQTWSSHSPDWGQTRLSAWSPRPQFPRRGPWDTLAPCSPAPLRIGLFVNIQVNVGNYYLTDKHSRGFDLFVKHQIWGLEVSYSRRDRAWVYVNVSIFRSFKL